MLSMPSSIPDFHQATNPFIYAEALRRSGEVAVRPLCKSQCTGHYIMKGGGEPETYEPKATFYDFCYVRVYNWPPGLGWFKHHSSTVGIPEAIGTLNHDSQLVSWG